MWQAVFRLTFYCNRGNWLLSSKIESPSKQRGRELLYRSIANKNVSTNSLELNTFHRKIFFVFIVRFVWIFLKHKLDEDAYGVCVLIFSEPRAFAQQALTPREQMPVNTKFQPSRLENERLLLIQIHHHSLLSSINHLFFFLPLLWQQSEPCLEAKQLRRLCHRYVCRVPRSLWKCAKFLMRLPASPHLHRLARLTDMLAGYRCWPVVPLFEMCSLCFSLQGSCDRIISPDAHSPGKMCEKIRLKGFTASWGTFFHSWNLHRKKNEDLLH